MRRESGLRLDRRCPYGESTREQRLRYSRRRSTSANYCWQACASDPRATREDRLFYSKHIISKSTASGRTALAFSPRNAAVLAFWTRSSRATSGPTAARSSVDPQCDGGLLRLSRSWDPRRRCNHGRQCDIVSTAASSESHRCNVQRPARATGDKWIQRAILQKRHAAMPARRRRPPERCGTTRSQRS